MSPASQVSAKSQASAAIDTRPDAAERVRQALAEKPDGVLEEVARGEGVPYAHVLDALASGQAVRAPGDGFAAIWGELAGWSGEITFIVHTLDGVFETRGTIPPGSPGRGYFNIHGESPIGGHIRADRCTAIYLVDRPFFGRRSCSVQFVNHDGEAMFKIFVGRDAARELEPRQVAAFEALTRRVATAQADQNRTG